MSREIKFRAWDIDNKKYEYDIAIRPINRIIGVEIFNNEMYPVEFRGIVEQYTGVKDKNGKEIYEGDIVREDIEVGDDDIDGEYRYQVVWDEETLCWSLSPNYGTIHKDLWETNLSREVIGNIHENPELLGGKK